MARLAAIRNDVYELISVWSVQNMRPPISHEPIIKDNSSPHYQTLHFNCPWNSCVCLKIGRQQWGRNAQAGRACVRIPYLYHAMGIIRGKEMCAWWGCRNRVPRVVRLAKEKVYITEYKGTLACFRLTQAHSDNLTNSVQPSPSWKANSRLAKKHPVL